MRVQSKELRIINLNKINKMGNQANSGCFKSKRLDDSKQVKTNNTKKFYPNKTYSENTKSMQTTENKAEAPIIKILPTTNNSPHLIKNNQTKLKVRKLTVEQNNPQEEGNTKQYNTAGNNKLKVPNSNREPKNLEAKKAAKANPVYQIANNETSLQQKIIKQQLEKAKNGQQQEEFSDLNLPQYTTGKRTEIYSNSVALKKK